MLIPVIPPVVTRYSEYGYHTIQGQISRDDDADELILLTGFLALVDEDNELWDEISQDDAYEFGYGVSLASLSTGRLRQTYFERRSAKQLYHPDVKRHVVPWVMDFAQELLWTHRPPMVVRRMAEAVPAGEPPPERFDRMTHFLGRIGYPRKERYPKRYSDGDRWRWVHEIDPDLLPLEES